MKTNLLLDGVSGLNKCSVLWTTLCRQRSVLASSSGTAGHVCGWAVSKPECSRLACIPTSKDAVKACLAYSVILLRLEYMNACISEKQKVVLRLRQEICIQFSAPTETFLMWSRASQVKLPPYPELVQEQLYCLLVFILTTQTVSTWGRERLSLCVYTVPGSPGHQSPSTQIVRNNK